MISKRANPIPEAPRRWSLADDYLADPAVAPMRALLAALVRRLERSRAKAARSQERPQPLAHRIHSPA